MTEHNYKISLITPVYNAVKYLANVLESVQGQTIGFENIEWLLVDDCSTDGSAQIISQWAAEHSNIKLLKTEKNSGTPAKPRNIGLDHATAPYIMFLDNDDALHLNACKALYDEISRTRVDIVTGDVTLMDYEGFSKKDKDLLLNYNDSAALGFHLMESPLGDWIGPFLKNHWCKIYRRDIIETNHIRCLEGKLWEDILFLFLYMSCVKDMVCIAEPIVSYRARVESLSHVYDKQFYCSLPKSIDFGMACAEQLGQKNAHRFVEMLTYGGHVEYYTDQLLGSETLSKEELDECLMTWKNTYVYSIKYGAQFHSAYCKILADDFLSGMDEKAIFHFHTLKELYKQRQREKDNILNSKTFRFAKKMSNIKQRITGGRTE